MDSEIGYFKYDNMRRQSDDYSRSHLSDVFEENETDLMPERSTRSIKSKSPDSFSSKPPKSDRKISNGSTNSDLYMEATGRRHSSDQGTILTANTDSFIIGQRVWVGGIRPGLIAYIGETHFAPGEWAGVVLDDPNGKNDGCVAGKRYFQCEPKRGIFSRLTRLTREPLPGGASSTSDLSMNVSSRSITSPSRSGTVSPTQSMKSFSGKTPTKSNLAVGDRVIVSSGMGSRPGILQYIGETKFAAGNWCGVQLDEATGKNDGSVDGVKYFDCPPQCGIFVPVAKVSLSPSARKSRLSRSGSKESLTSVGTMGSIASTATSRLRMSAQRLSSAPKPITTPKNTFSLQEVLREKQNHIEHLLIERDLDRQDAENNAMMYQKTINQLKETITSLEKQLTNEKQKSEDLQTSVDEATFCTDELNVLTQEYKDRVAVLEAQVSGKEIPDGEPTFEDSKQNEEISRLRKQCELLTTSLAEKQSEIQSLEQANRILQSQIESNGEVQQASVNEFTSKISALESSQKSLEDQVQYLTHHTEGLESELRLKDETKEQEYLSIKHIENELREEVNALKMDIQQLEIAKAGGDSDVQKLIEAKDTIIAEQKESAIGSEQLHMIIVKQKEEEIAQINSSLKQLRELNESLSSEKSNFIKEREENIRVVGELQTKVEEGSKLSVKLQSDLEVNLRVIEGNKQQIDQHEKTIKTLESKVEQMSTRNTELEAKVNELHESASDAVEKGKVLEAELRQNVQITTESLNESEKRMAELRELLVSRDKCLEEQQKSIIDEQSKFEELSSRNEALLKELNDFRTDSVSKDEGVSRLNGELTNVTNELNKKCSELEVSEKNLSLAVEESKVLSQQISELTNEAESLKATLNTNVNSIANLNAEIVQLQDAHKSDTQIADSLNKEVQALNSQIDRITTDNSSLKEDLKNAQIAFESKKLESESQSNVTKELTLEIDQLQKTLQTKNEAVDKIQKMNENLQSQLDASVQSGNDLQEKLSKLEVEYGDLNRKMGLMEEKCEQMSLEKASLQQNVDALQNSSSDTNSEVHRLSAELQQKQKSYDELVDKSNAVQLSLEKTLHETTQNLVAKSAQLDRVKNEMETVTMQKIDRENELNVELSTMKEAAVEEKTRLVQEMDQLKASYQEEKVRLLKELDGKLNDSVALRSEIENLGKTVNELQNSVEQSKSEMVGKENEFEAKVKILQSVEEDLKRQLDESSRKESELRNSFTEVTKSGAESVEQLTQQLNDKIVYAAQLESNIQELQTRYDRTTVEHNDLKAKLLEMEKVNEELTKSIKEEKNEFISLKSNLEQQLTEAVSKFKSTEEDQVDLVNQNSQLSQQIEELTKAVLETNNSKSEINDQLTHLREEVEAFKVSAEAEKLEICSKLVESHNKEIEEKQKEMDVISTSLREANNENETLKSNAATLKGSTQAEIVALQQEAADHLKTIRLLEDKIEQLTSSVNLSDDLKNELNHKSEEIKSKETKIAELSVTVSTLQEQFNVNENDLKRLADEKEVEKKRLTDVIDSKDDEIKTMHQQLATVKKTLDDKIVELASLSDESSSLLLEKNSLVEELASLNSQMQDYATNSVDLTELNNLREEFSIFEETKRQEIVDLTKRLVEVEKRLQSQSASVAKFDILEREQKEILYEKTALQRREAQLVVENKQLADKLLQMKANSTAAPAPEIVSDTESGAQISFLNSIIADMQRKNESLTYRIQALESAPSDFVNNGLFDLPVKRKPAPRVFCDICDEFDAHETEDCPLQSSDSPPPINLPEMTSTVNLISKDATKERKVPPPRKYCETCEVFGHDTSECDSAETY
ncbi:restin homolog isoform X5 [Bradysia coprophila]|uniref:restin homolog isoform X5 n=1 Tax=Bradysia coprophila TaxID=38358 RepID=UPI00187DC765|nr:restin homolog isoform X5 [Bradysia coprophila]